MRPIRITLAGFRSYREKQCIEFGEAGIIAIVGDTGAGKSTLLEAITYAFFNATTWDERNPRALIADGMQTMAVTLEFEAQDSLFRITRSTSLDSHPPSVHLLEKISGPGTAVRLDKEAEIKVKLKEVLGLDYEGFCAAVLLPQGRFQTLLFARNSDKIQILRDILGLEKLERMRASALERARSLEAEINKGKLRLAELTPFPAAVIEEQEAILAEGRSLIGKLRGLSEGFTKLGEARSGRLRESEEVEEKIGRLERNPLCIHDAQDVQGWQGKLEGQLEQLYKELAQQEVQGEELRQQISTVNEVTLSTQAGLATELADLLEIIPLKTVEVQALQEVRRGLYEKEACSEDSRNSLQLKVDTLQESIEGLRAEEDAARLVLDQWQNLVSQRRQILAELDRRKAAQISTQDDLRRARNEVDRCRGDLAVRQEEYARWTAQQEAHVVHGLRIKLQPGENCPVCLQAVENLPAGEDGPDCVQLLDAPELLRQAEGVMTAATTMVEVLGRREQEEGRQIAALESDILRFGKEMEPLATNGLEEVRWRRIAQEKSIGLLRGCLQEATRDLRNLQQQESATAARLAASQTKLENLEVRQREMSGLLPHIERFDSENLRLLASFRTAQSEWLHEQKQRRGAIQVSIEELHRSIHTVEKELQSAPLLVDIRDNLVRLEGDLGCSSLTKELRATTVLQVVEQALVRKQEEVNYLQERKSSLSQGIEQLRDQEATLIGAGIEAGVWEGSTTLSLGVSRDLIQTKLVGCLATERVAEGRLAKAQVDRPLVEAMVGAMKPAEARLEALLELGRLLADGKFIRFVVERKEVALLEAASTILGKMSGGKLGFALGFNVTQRGSGMARDPRTLSGGETFLASLSLALGLVEVAGRDGGRLGALFLDEGFGSLDGQTLDEALDALEGEALAGKLVAIVSHLKTVAERIDRVLVVTRDSSQSSIATWTTSEEGDSVDAQDFMENLLQ